MRTAVAICVALVAIGAVAADGSRSEKRFLDALSVGDHVIVRPVQLISYPTDFEVAIVGAAELRKALPTQEEIEEYRSLGGISVPSSRDVEGFEKYKRDRERRNELLGKVHTSGGSVVDVGEDFVAVKAADGDVIEIPSHSLVRITARLDEGASQDGERRNGSSDQPRARRLLNLLSAGDMVILREERTGTFEVLKGSLDDLQGQVATLEERREYEDLESDQQKDTLLISPLGTVPGGDRDGLQRRLEENRRQLELRRQRTARLAELKPRTALRSITLKEVGEDFIAYDVEGATTYLASSRISSINVRNSANANHPDAK